MGPKKLPERNRASVVCFYGGALLTVKLEDPLTKIIRCFPPGGKIEPHETPEQAAIRETLEETGYQVELDLTTHFLADYPFEWGGTTYDCHTVFYRGRLLSLRAAPVNDANYHRGVYWLPESRVAKTFAYHSVLLSSILALQ